MSRKAMLIDLARCAGCGGCVVSCQMQNNTRPDVVWNQLERCEWDEYPDAGRCYLPHSCMHCDDAPCVATCPTGASYTNDEKVTLVNYEECICCGQCVLACPYGARHINKNEDNFFDASEPAPYESYGVQREDVAEKCIFCNELVEQGKQPACVLNCPGKARFFGDIEDAESPIAQKIAAGAKRVGETGFYYIEPAGMPSNMILSKVAPDLAPVAGSGDNGKTKAAAGINPVVVGVAAGAVVVAAGAGTAVAVSRSRKKKAAEAAAGAGQSAAGQSAGQGSGAAEQSAAGQGANGKGDGGNDN